MKYFNRNFLDFSEEKPPSVTVHTVRGYTTLGPANELLVYPDSIIHLDCLFDRKLGNPQWKQSNKDKIYPTGFVTIPLFSPFSTFSREFHSGNN